MELLNKVADSIAGMIMICAIIVSFGFKLFNRKPKRKRKGKK